MEFEFFQSAYRKVTIAMNKTVRQNVDESRKFPKDIADLISEYASIGTIVRIDSASAAGSSLCMELRNDNMLYTCAGCGHDITHLHMLISPPDAYRESFIALTIWIIDILNMMMNRDKCIQWVNEHIKSNPNVLKLDYSRSQMNSDIVELLSQCIENIIWKIY